MSKIGDKFIFEITETGLTSDNTNVLKSGECEKVLCIVEKNMDELEKYQTWIPVSERLPNTGEAVLLTVPVNRGISHGYGSVDIAWICDKDNKCFYGTDGKYSFEQVIAWQPLPEPYKEVSR